MKKRQSPLEGKSSARGLASKRLGWAERTLPAEVAAKLISEGGTTSAIVLAWHLLTSIFPIVLTLAAIAGFVFGQVSPTSNTIYSLTIQVFPANFDARQATLSGASQLHKMTGILALSALLGFLWTASNLFGAMEEAFNRAYGVRNRSFLRQKLMALGMMVVFSILALIGLAAAAILPIVSSLTIGPFQADQGPVAITLQAVVGVSAAVVLFFCIYVVVPNTALSLRHAWSGAVLAGSLFELLSLEFPLYAHFNRGLNLYGKYFAGLFTLLAFFYLVGLITMIGVELNAVLARRRGDSNPRPGLSPRFAADPDHGLKK